MSKSILSKVAAIACGAASLAVMSMTAMAAEKVLEINKTNYPEMKDGVINFVATKVTVNEADVKAAADGYVVHYTVEVANNTGFVSAGVAVVYDPKLEVVMQDGKPVCEKGPVGSQIGVVKENLSKHLVGCGTAVMDPITQNGKYITIDFKLPKNAKAGDKFEMGWDIDGVVDAKDDDAEYQQVNGYIEVVADPTPITTVTTTTTTAPTTTSTTPTTSAPTPTTSKQADTIVTTTSTTPASGTGSTTSKATTASTAKPGTTTKAANGGNNANSTKTGDAGAGVAAAALLLAAGTAVAAGKKKKD